MINYRNIIVGTAQTDPSYGFIKNNNAQSLIKIIKDKNLGIDTDPTYKNSKDFLIGIAASGTTPYVLGAIEKAATKGIQTGCIVCSKNSPIAKAVAFPIEVVVGPEFVTGSTRMKSGTAQKLCLNMISTSVMIKLGKVKGNKMVDMQLNNHKLEERAANMLMNEIKVSRSIADKLLKQYGNVRKAADAYVKAKKKA